MNNEPIDYYHCYICHKSLEGIVFSVGEKIYCPHCWQKEQMKHNKDERK